MEIRFATRRLERRANDMSAAERAWGSVVARRYVQRLAVIANLPSFDALFHVRSFRAHPLKGQRRGQFAITLTGRWRLIVSPASGGTAVLVEEVSSHYGD